MNLNSNIFGGIDIVQENHFMQIVLLLWGFAFCIVAALCMLLSSNYDKQKRKCLIYMQSFTALLLVSDALAYYFRGYSGNLGSVMVHISNFIVFLMSEVILAGFHTYVCIYLLKKEEWGSIKRVKLGYIICAIGAGLVLISQFTGFYYYIDADNFYHRAPAYIISWILPVIVMLMDASLIIQFRGRVRNRILFSMLSYIVLPVGAAIIQVGYYGISFINFSIGISMVIMFMAAMSELNQEMYDLLTSESRIRAQKEKLQYISYRDMLTTLYNRNKYLEVVNPIENEKVSRAGVAYIDINGLKQMNDEYGHDAGDKLIVSVARAIIEVLPENAYRIGGDEFVIICRDTDEKSFYESVEKIKAGIKKSGASASVGHIWSDKAYTLKEMLKRADERMYTEKEAYHKNYINP